jgi:hypothetical protein
VFWVLVFRLGLDLRLYLELGLRLGLGKAREELIGAVPFEVRARVRVGSRIRKSVKGRV